MPASITWSPLTRFSYTLVRPFTSSDFDGQHFLQHVRLRRTLPVPTPPFHRSAGRRTGLYRPAAAASPASKDRWNGVHLVVHQVVQLQHVHHAHGDLALERFAGAAVVQATWFFDGVMPRCVAMSSGYARSSMRRISSSVRAVEHRRRERHALLQVLRQFEDFLVGLGS